MAQSVPSTGPCVCWARCSQQEAEGKAGTEDPGEEDRLAGAESQTGGRQGRESTAATLQHLGKRSGGGLPGEVPMPEPEAWGGPEGTGSQTGIQMQIRLKE